MIINLIVATTENGVIGKEGDMPWSIPADLRNFRKVTTMGESNIVIMGRKTYDSIGKALPGRTNYVITRNRNTDETSYIDAQVYNTIQDALDHAQGIENLLKRQIDIHIIGGASIYDQVMEMDIVDKIYHTLIHTSVDGDTFFHVPEWEVRSNKSYLADEENEYDYTFKVLTRAEDLRPSQNVSLRSL